jgi:hypothetical protein
MNIGEEEERTYKPVQDSIYFSQGVYKQHSDSYGCGDYGVNWNWEYNHEGSRSCSNCGYMDPHWKDLDYSGPTYWQEKRENQYPVKHTRISAVTRATLKAVGFKIGPGGGIVSQGVRHSEGRYKPKFHLSERISQWCTSDAPLPEGVWSRILESADSGTYGARGDFDRGTVIKLLRDLDLTKYRERWKSILHQLNPALPMQFPDTYTTEFIQDMFNNILREFYYVRDSMPKSLTKGKTKKLALRMRHNFLSYNYVIRKILEMVDIYCWHDEFPVPISHLKLIALDDVMEKICERLHAPFTRSVIIRFPKYKKSKKLREELRVAKLERRTKSKQQDSDLQQIIDDAFAEDEEVCEMDDATGFSKITYVTKEKKKNMLQTEGGNKEMEEFEA